MIPTLFSVSYGGLWGQEQLDLPAFVRKASALGYSAVELAGKRPHLSVLDASDAKLAELRQTAESVGVEIATVAGYTNFTLGRGSEVPGAEIQIAYVRALAQMARKLGAKIVRVFTGYTTEAEAAAGDWEISVRARARVCPRGRRRGSGAGRAEPPRRGRGSGRVRRVPGRRRARELPRDVRSLGAGASGRRPARRARRLAPRMVQTTLADYVRLGRYEYLPGLVNYRRLTDMVRAVPLGEGFLDLDGFFAGLREGGFSGYVAYEMCSPLRGGGSMENLDRAASKSLGRIRGWIAG